MTARQLYPLAEPYEITHRTYSSEARTTAQASMNPQSTSPRKIGGRDIVQRLWNLCNLLRHDGISYQDYLNEITFLLFLKMSSESDSFVGRRREFKIPEPYTWSDLIKLDGPARILHYRSTLQDLGSSMDSRSGRISVPTGVQAIFQNAHTKIRQSEHLDAIVDSIDEFDWFSSSQEALGDVYEGLLEKNASDKKSGAGQYFTPRSLIDSIVRVIRPQVGEVIQDPAAGTGGFLLAAHNYIMHNTDGLRSLSPARKHTQLSRAYTGMELVPETYRLALMNLSLHGIHSGILMGDCLSTEGAKLGQASVVLTNPPFGSKKGAGRAMRPELKITHASGNKQLSFLEHAALSLREGGRAAVVVPDNVLFEDNVGRRLRTWLLKYFNVHTILRLPLGIFYAQGVKTNVIFFNKLPSGSLGTQRVWMYDLRTGVPPFGRTKALQSHDLAAFETAFGDDRFGEADRQDQGANGRFRCFTREDIAACNDSLDLGWLVEEEMSEQHQSDDPAEIAAALALHLRGALDCVEALSADLSDGVTHAE